MLRLSVPQRRKSLFATRRPYQSLLNIRNSDILPALEESAPSKDNTIKKKEVCNISSCCKTKVYNGEPLVDNDMPKSLIFTSQKNILQGEINIPCLPSLPSPNVSSFDKIFEEKIKICKILFNFTKQNIQINGKKEKTKALNEINMLLSKNMEASLLTDQEKCLIFEMIWINIFEQDPFISSKNMTSSTLKLSFTESSWEHLFIVYNILNQFVLMFPEKCQFDLIKRGIRLMNIPDLNEIDNLVTFLKNYSKVHPKQFDAIWNQLKLALNNVRCGIYTVYCVEPILSYMSYQFISYSTTFCTKYLSTILYTHLLPLFENEKLSLYYSKLSSFIIQIVEKSFDDQLNTIQFLLKHFPIQVGQKQPLFVNTLISITSNMKSEQLNPIADKIFTFIATSLKSPNSKLAESALLFLMKPNLKPIIFLNYENAMAILYEPLKWSSSNYWEKSVKDQSSAAFSTLMNAKLEFAQNISLSEFVIDSNDNDNKNDQSTKKTYTKDLAQTWGFLSRIAARRYHSIDLTKSLSNIQLAFS